MMYFSRVRIETSSLLQTKLFNILQGNIYAMHQLIWKLFPENPNAKRNFLFRQEFEKEQLSFPDIRRGLPIFYVVSEKQPSPVYGMLSVETKHYNPKLRTGMRLCFDVRVNPVVARIRKGKKNSAKHDIMMDAKKQAREKGITDCSSVKLHINTAVVQWLASKGKKSGFNLTEKSMIEVSGYCQHFLRKKGTKEIKFSSVDLTGTLMVTNPELFKSLLFKGIGHARSFGCGMMMVRRI